MHKRARDCPRDRPADLHCMCICRLDRLNMSVWLLLITLLVVCLAVFNVPKYLWFLYRRNRAIRHVPGWPTHWLLGNLHQFRLDHSTLVKWAEFIQKNRHKVAKIWLGPFYPVIEICHPSGVHKVINLPKDRSIYLGWGMDCLPLKVRNG